MRIAIVTMPARSHAAAMAALGARLRARGHRVTLVGLPEAEPAVARTGLPFIPVGVPGWNDTTARDAMAAVSRTHGETTLRTTIALSASLLQHWLRPLESVLRIARFEGVIFDDSQQYIALPAIRLGMPHAQVACAVHIDMTGRTPLCFQDWPSQASAEASARNAAGVKHFLTMLDGARQLARAYAREAGLDLDWSDPTVTTSRIAWITQVPRCLDFDRPSGPPGLVHAGPLRDDTLRRPVPFPWDRLTAAPLVYASLGTVLTGHIGIFRCIVEVARRRPKLQFVVAAGEILDLEGLGSIPDNVVLVRFAPQPELLKRASLCITHAGLNTVLEALAEGVPLVAIPIAFDQPGVGARIREKGAGEVVPLRVLSTEALGSALDRVMDEGRFREGAARQRDGIAAADGLNRAAAAIETAFAGASR